jgi:hypothetical protein
VAFSFLGLFAHRFAARLACCYVSEHVGFEEEALAALRPNAWNLAEVGSLANRVRAYRRHAQSPDF